jgi:hypothetical protein
MEMLSGASIRAGDKAMAEKLGSYVLTEAGLTAADVDKLQQMPWKTYYEVATRAQRKLGAELAAAGTSVSGLRAWLRTSLMDFIKSGKGVIGIHDAIATFVQWPVYDQWPEFGRMVGGTENGGHPWNGEAMTMRVEDRDNPINAAFGGKDFEIADQAFQLQEPVFATGCTCCSASIRREAPKRIVGSCLFG